MTNNSRNVEEIERDIERERAQLSRSLDALQSQFSLEGIFRQASDQVSRHGGEFGSSISRSVKSNPIALALTGVGLAWMIYGDNRKHDNASTDGRTTTRTMHTSHVGDDATKAYGTHDTVGDFGSGSSDSGSSRLSHAADTVSGAASDAKRAVSDRWDLAQSSASDYADSASAYARQTRASAEDLRRRLYEGTENLSESARQKVVAARERAQQAQERIENAAKRGTSEAVDFFQSQPLVAGALALAVGAAIGALAPRTKPEDDAAGAHSDRLFDEAERLFRAEAEKAEKVVKKAVSEAKTIAREEKAKADSKAPGEKTAAEAVVSKAKSSGKRVAGAAKKEASKQKLGQPESSSS